MKKLTLPHGQKFVVGVWVLVNREWRGESPIGITFDPGESGGLTAERRVPSGPSTLGLGPRLGDAPRTSVWLAVGGEIPNRELQRGCRPGASGVIRGPSMQPQTTV